MRAHKSMIIRGALSGLLVVLLSGCRPEIPAPGGPSGPVSSGFPNPGCVDFDDYPHSKFAAPDYTDGGDIESRGAEIDFHDFIMTPSPPPVYYRGIAELRTTKLAGGSGNEFNLSSIAIDFHLQRELNNLSFKYRYTGGLTLLQVNGHRNLINDSFSAMGPVGGVTLAVSNVTSVPGGERATLTLTGKISGPVYVGGQELWVDDFCTK
ncbi:MAG: hypothetical protein GY719_05735 [bacterium]|nr:hypothetical protein [bacterium]